jgi:aspartate 1-decarboxylase
MRLTMLKGKIHRATVTQAELNYEGSLTIDANLLEASGILPFEEIHVWNVTNGARFTTYALHGEPGSGVMCVNGAGARLAHPGDLIIIAAYCQMDDKEARGHQPRVVLVDERNRMKKG